MRRLIWSFASRRDLIAIEEFIGADSPSAALRMIGAIRERAEQLRRFPASGPSLGGEIRSLTVRGTPFLVIYRINDGRIEIARIRHAREDWRPE
jgi:plasmid stabilization system protein ParE